MIITSGAPVINSAGQSRGCDSRHVAQYASGFFPTPPHDDAVASGSELAPPLPPGDFHPQSIAHAGRTQERCRCAAPLARSVPGSALEAPARHGRAPVARSSADQSQRFIRHAARCCREQTVFLSDPLSSSRPPRPGRPCGPSHAIGFTDPVPTRKHFGAYEEERTRLGPAGRGAHAWPQYYTDECLRTRKRRMVTAPDRVLPSGSRSILARPGEE